MRILFWASFAILFNTYFGYPLLIRALASTRGRHGIGAETINDKSELHTISVIVAAFNEEDTIAGRIENLIELDYPKDKVEIIVASDGSTDRTPQIAEEYAGVKVLDFKQNRGRAFVHNDAVRAASGEILVFTDAETLFDKTVLKEISRSFLDDRAGCVVGNLVYKTDETSISKSEGFYWGFEKKLREGESALGLLATATGACMAVRKGLWKDIFPIGDCDYIAPLDIIFQGYKVLHNSRAEIYDIPPSTASNEFNVRIRQTSTNLVGTVRHWGWRCLIKHPVISFGLFSHKIARWLTPLFLVGAFIGNVFLLGEGPHYRLVFIMQLAFYLSAMLGFAGELLKRRIPIASTAFSFCVASAGMGVGILKGLIGKAPTSYGKEE